MNGHDVRHWSGDFLEEAPGYWPTTQMVKARHLQELQDEIASLKAAAESKQLEEEYFDEQL